MKKLLALGAAALAVAACGKSLPENPKPATVIVANFDPGANPPVVPSPNDLAFNPATGTLNVPSGSSPADAEFAAYLNTLNGFPADAQASTTFSGKLDPASVTDQTVKIFSWDGTNLTPVTGTSIGYTDVAQTTAQGAVTVSPPATGWTAGGTYVAVVVGYDNGVKGAKKEPVIASPAFALIRSANKLANCDANGQNCTATTGLIPATGNDPASKVAERNATAGQLEQLRQHYAPFFTALEGQGIPRNQVANLWSYKIASNIVTPAFILNPADPCATHIPVPNDLAIDPATGNVNAPTGCAGMTPSENEFISDYLNHLNGFPTSATAGEGFVGGKLNPSTVALSPQSVLVIDLTDAAADGGTGAITPSGATYSATTNAITISPPADGWPKGHEIAVALLPGLKGSNGEQLVASDVFALVRSSQPLVDCDLTDPSTDPTTCHSVMTLAPLTDEQATQLEMLRLKLSPVIDALGIDRSQLAMLWTFRVYDNPEANFKLALNASDVVIPFPFTGRHVPVLGDALHFYIPGPDGGPGHINLPSAIPLAPALNTLDGFSTTAPILTAFGGSNPNALIDGNVDPASINPTDPDAGTVYTVGLRNLSGNEPPQFLACVNCGRPSDLLDAGSLETTEQLTIIPSIPLTEQTDYAGYVTIGLKDTQGRNVVPTSAFALLRMKNPITDSAGNLQIPEIAAVASPAELAILENARQAFSDLYDQLDAQGLPRGQLALAWDFHTQTTWSALAKLHAYPQALAAAGFPTNSSYAYDVSSKFLGDGGLIPGPLQQGIGKVLIASAPTPNLLHQNDGGLGPFNIKANGQPGNLVPEEIPLIVYEPATAPADGGAVPVVLFGHGVTRWRGDSAALASAVTQAGFALVAYDEPFHGDRSFCAGAHQAVSGVPSDDYLCQAPTGQTASCDESGSSPTYGRCIGTNPSVCAGATLAAAVATEQVAQAIVLGNVPASAACQAYGQGNCNPYTQHCEGATFKTDASGKPLISGWDFMDLTAIPNYFFLPTRDHLRQAVVDLGQLELVMANPATDGGSLNDQLVAQGGNALDATSVGYVGQSLGGILGTLYTSASPLVGHSVLNVPGGNLVGAIMTSPGLAELHDPLFQALAAQGVTPGTESFDQFFDFTQWVMDPADPVNAANFLNTPSPLAPSNRAVLVQYIQADEVIPNNSTQALIASANRYGTPEVTVTEYQPPAADWPIPGTVQGAPGRHGFLLNGFGGHENETCYTVKAQTEAAYWLATGTEPANWAAPVTSCP